MFVLTLQYLKVMYIEFQDDDPIIYVLTPTQKHPFEKALLTQMAQIFSMTPIVFWIIVEDAIHTFESVERVIQVADLKHRSYHFAYKEKEGKPNK